MAKRLTVAETAAIERELKKLADGSDVPMSVVGLSRQTAGYIKAARDKQNAVEKQLISERNKSRLAIAGAAHDLKTPLSIISGAAECIKDGLDDKDYLQIISEKAAQMSETVATIVDVARQETRAEKTLKEWVSAREFFRTQILRHKSLADARKIKLKIEKIPKIDIEIDVTKMSRVIQNLITNAVKYTPEGGKITVSFGYSLGVSHRKLKVTVADNGRGVAKENLPFVFDKFYMEDASRSHGGSGLGLYVAKDIVEEHGGSIGVKNRLGGGSKFWFSLPLAEKRLREEEKRKRLPRGVRVLLTCLFFFAEPWVYRFVKFFRTFHAATLFGAWFSIPFFMFMWMVDAISVAVYDKPVFLAD